MVSFLKVFMLLGLVGLQMASAEVTTGYVDFCKPADSVPMAAKTWFKLENLKDLKSKEVTSQKTGVSQQDVTYQDMTTTYKSIAGSPDRNLNVQFDKKSWIDIAESWFKSDHLKLSESYVTITFLDADGKDTSHIFTYHMEETRDTQNEKRCHIHHPEVPYTAFRVEAVVMPKAA